MKKSLIAIAFAAATLTFAQTPAPSQTQPDQTATTTKKVKKTSKHKSNKTNKTSTTSAPQK